MRISTSMIYDNAILNMNKSLADYVGLSEQNASKKRINRPSDDPSGMRNVLTSRTLLSEIAQRQENLDTAKGWLTAVDDSIESSSTLVIRLEELAQQASTETLSAEQRSMIALEAREIYEELVRLANTEFNGDHVLAGHKTDSPAFETCLWATVDDDTLGQDAVVSVSGSSATSIKVQFTSAGTVGTDALTYRYSMDGGNTWIDATLAAGDTELDLGGVQVGLAAGSVVSANTGVDDDTGGTILFVRPAAQYLGDDNDTSPVSLSGTSQVSATAQGYFSGDVLVRFDSDANISGRLDYSYSTDGGHAWVTGQTATGGVLAVPGGYVELTAAPSGDVYSGDILTVRPHEADIKLPISGTSSVTVNAVGKDIFGGLYNGEAAGDPDSNLLEIAGELIGYMEFNQRDAIGDSLEKLKSAHEQLTSAAGEIGGRINRVELAQTSLTLEKDRIETFLSSVEDVNEIQLSVDLARSEYIYQSVLSTSSKILKLSLLDYM
ncbi:MAG: flagellin [Desulfocurvibacter africanus]